MILQLEPTVPLDTPKGRADAHFLIDYGSQQHLLWVCFIRETGECWTYQNPLVRLEANPTEGIRTADGDRSLDLALKQIDTLIEENNIISAKLEKYEPHARPEAPVPATEKPEVGEIKVPF